ncbi:MAG: hypothetical protein NC311_10140 [Muribaculaceae bacterium]|nr:hypothetical protein [Muribaculaceae bacterium]
MRQTYASTQAVNSHSSGNAAQPDSQAVRDEAMACAGVMGYDPYEDSRLDEGNPFGGDCL